VPRLLALRRQVPRGISGRGRPRGSLLALVRHILYAHVDNPEFASGIILGESCNRESFWIEMRRRQSLTLLAASALTLVSTLVVGAGVANAATPADPPTGVHLTVTAGGIVVNWTAPTNTGTDSSGSTAAITSYNVYESTSPGGESLTSPGCSIAAPATSCELVAQVVGTTYYVEVTALNPVESAVSAEVSVDYLPTVPTPNVTLSVSPSSPTYLTGTTLIATLDQPAPGSVAFLVDGVGVAGCGGVPVDTSGSPFTATCAYTPPAASPPSYTVDATFTSANTSNYLSTSASEISFSVGQASPAPLMVTSTSAAYGTTLSLTTTGGSGTGSLSFSVTNGSATGCQVIAGPALVSTSAGTCIVTATQSADANYLAVSSTPTAVVFSPADRGNQGTLTIASTTGTYGTPVTLTTSGGVGTGAVSYSVTNGTATGCQVAGSMLTASSAGTCLVTASKAADANHLAATSTTTPVTFAEANQPTLRVTSPFGVLGQSLTMTTSGGAGSGRVTFAVASGSAKGCQVSGSALSVTSTGTCLVTATKATDGNYLSTASAPTTVTFNSGAQATLTMTSTRGTYGTAITLAASGGFSTGALSYSVKSGTALDCKIRGTALTATSAGTCLVTATRATDANYPAVSSHTTTVTFVRATQAKITLTSRSGKFASASHLTLSGGSGTGVVSFSVVDGSATGCHVTGSKLRATSTGTCLVRALKGASRNYLPEMSSRVEFHFTRAPQRFLVVTTTSGDVGAPLTLATSGGSGRGVVTFRVTNGTSKDCVARGDAVTSVGVGTCVVVATKSADKDYLSVSSVPTTVTILAAVHDALRLLSTRGTYGATSLLSSSGGSGTGAVSFTVTDLTANGCSILGSPGHYVLTATTAGTCVVTVVKVGDGHNAGVKSAGTPFIFARARQPSVRITTIHGPAHVPLALHLAGGAGTGGVVYRVIGGTASHCVVTSRALVSTSPGTCRITATKDGDRDYRSATTTARVTFALVNQAALSIVPVTGAAGAAVNLTTNGGSGSGQLSFQLRTGSSNSCSLRGSTLRSAVVATCLVRATKSADPTYLTTNSPVVQIKFIARSIAKVLTASATTGLHSGERVRVSGRGLTANEHLTIAECLLGATNESMCNRVDARSVVANVAGDLTATYLTVATGRVGARACGTLASDLHACEIRVWSGNFIRVSGIAIGFSPTVIGRSFRVSPSTHLKNGDVVTVSGTGFTPGDSVSFAECLVGPITATRCDVTTFVTVKISRWGVLPVTRFVVKAGKIGPSTCGTKARDLNACDITVANASLHDDAVVHITFIAP